MGVVKAKTWGIAMSLAYKRLTTSFAYNRNSTNYGAIPSLGGGPFFTSMEDQTLDAVTGEYASAMLLAVEYAVSDSVNLGMAVGQFNARNKDDYNVGESDVYLKYSWNDQASIEVMYAEVKDENISAKDQQLRAILTYDY